MKISEKSWGKSAGLSLVAVLAACGGGNGSVSVVESAPVVKDGVSCTTAMVPMSDGTKLYTEIYRPANQSAETRLPVLVSRSPYGKLIGSGCFSTFTSQAKNVPDYVAIYQSVRGTSTSEGNFTPFFQEQQDGYDMVAWAGRQTWSNGKVGLTGSSYPGAAVWQAALKAPSNLVAIAPHETAADYRDDWVARNGVFDIQFARTWPQGSFMADQIERSMKAQGATADQIKSATDAFNARSAENKLWVNVLPFSATFDALTRTLLPWYWEWLEHPNYDEYWSKIDVNSQYEAVKVPAVITGGWYDLFAKGSIDSFIGMKDRAGTQLARDGTMLIMDCCGHGWSRAKSPSEIIWTGDRDSSADAVRQAFLDKYVLGRDNGFEQQPKVQLSVMVPPDSGLQGSVFRFNTSAWPVPGTIYTQYHLSSGGNANTLNGDGRLDSVQASSGPADSFLYDPLNPVPTLGGRDSQMALDQTPVQQRADVLVYSSAPITQSMAVIGKVSVSFWAQTDGRDTDFTAKLVDVHPDGMAHNVVDRIVRGRYRKGSNLAPELLTPNTPYPFTLDLGYTATLLKPGHQLRLEISSSNFPQYQRNLNTGASNENSSETRIARNTILHDASHPSFLTIPVVPGVAPP